jgi:tripartite-type tricarboxylate transporter receptor subunit TctC
LRDLIEAARTNPGKIKCGGAGVLTLNHLMGIELEKASGVRFAIVNFDGGAPALTALLGGSSDFYPGVVSDFAVRHKSGDVRVLAVLGKEESRFLPGVKTAEVQGYELAPLGSSRGWVVPTGTPQEIIDLLSQATKKGTEDAELKERTRQMGMTVRYLAANEYASHWKSIEAQVVPLLEQAGVKVPK